jgi:regulation of enolase protein 1 (concanavalin A-like superfamily)
MLACTLSSIAFICSLFFSEVNAMARSIFALASLLLSCAALAAPAPELFVSGWGSPIDPDRDCKFKRYNGILTIEMPGGDHGYDTARKRLNAPRLVSELEGDFQIQLRLRIDSRPSAKSTVKGQPSFVAAGFLVIPPETFSEIFIRLQYGIAGEGDGADGFASQLSRDVEGGSRNGVCDKRWPKWPFKAEPEHVYLRLERWGNILSHSISPDGKLWVPAGGCHLSGLPSKLKVGLAAYSTSTDPSKVHFDQLKLTRGKKRERWDFVTSWGDPMDPDKDCKIQRDKDSLTIEMPGTDHDYDPARKRFNAPRLLSDLEGNFDLQVRVQIDNHPSAQSTVKGQPSFVSAGFLLIYPDSHERLCERLEYAVSQKGSRLNGYAVAPMLPKPRREGPAPKGKEADGYAVKKVWSYQQRKANAIEGDSGRPIKLGRVILWDRGWQDWPLPEKADCAYLRLEQRDKWSCFFISPDGKKWTALIHMESLPAKGKVGLAAYSTSTEPSMVVFDQIKLARDKKKEDRKKE